MAFLSCIFFSQKEEAKKCSFSRGWISGWKMKQINFPSENEGEENVLRNSFRLTYKRCRSVKCTHFSLYSHRDI